MKMNSGHIISLKSRLDEMVRIKKELEGDYKALKQCLYLNIDEHKEKIDEQKEKGICYIKSPKYPDHKPIIARFELRHGQSDKNIKLILSHEDAGLRLTDVMELSLESANILASFIKRHIGDK